MELFTQEKIIVSSKANRTPDDPMMSMPPEVLDFDEEMKPWLESQVAEGKIPEVQQGEEKISLVWHSGAGVAIRAMDILHSDSGVPTEQVVAALEGVLGPIATTEESTDQE